MTREIVTTQQRGTARGFGREGCNVDFIARHLIERIVSSFDVGSFPGVNIGRDDNGFPYFEMHCRRIKSRMSHVFLKKGKLEVALGGQLTFLLEPQAPTKDELAETILVLTFDQHGQASMTDYPSIHFLIEERPPHVGSASKLITDSLLHEVQSRLNVISY